MDFKKLTAKMKENKPDKTGWVIFILVGILFLVVTFPSKDGGNDEKKEERELQETKGSGIEKREEGDTLEKQLETALSNVEGVGNVKVMITYKDSGTQVIEKDREVSDNSTVEEDAGGGSRRVTGRETQETTVYAAGSGDGEPFVTKELTPEIEGILIVAQGGDKTSVRQNISNAVLALFPVEAHKIVVVKMNDQEGGN